MGIITLLILLLSSPLEGSIAHYIAVNKKFFVQVEIFSVNIEVVQHV